LLESSGKEEKEDPKKQDKKLTGCLGFLRDRYCLVLKDPCRYIARIRGKAKYLLAWFDSVADKFILSG
jgi:hypothetical protein